MINNNVIRIHQIWLLIELLKIGRNCIVIFFFLLFLNNWININIIVIYIIISIVLLYSTISMLLFWKNFKVFVLENKIIIQKGTFIKNIVHLNHDKITGIDEKNNILEKMINLNSIVIKVNSINNDESITIPKIDQKNIKKIKNSFNIINDENSQKPDDIYFKTDIIDIFKNSLSSFNIIIFFLFLYSIYSTISDYINIDWILIMIKTLSLNNSFSIMISIFTILLLTYIYTLIKTLIRYKNFTLVNHENTLIINSGVLSRMKVTILKSSISAIIIKSTVVQNLLNFEEIKVIGMNPKDKDRKKTEEEILPFSKKSDSIKHLRELLSYNIENEEFHKIKNKIFLLKWIRKSFYFIFSIPFIVIFNNFYLNIFLYSLYLYSVIYQLVYVLFTSYSFSKSHFIFRKNSMNIEHIIIPYKDIEEIIIKQTLFQKMFKVGSLVIVNKAIPVKKFTFLDIPIIELLKIQNLFLNKNY